MRRRFVFPFLLALVWAAPALAADVHVRLSVRGGGLHLRAPEVLRPGATRLTLDVVDARGTAAGWTLALRSPGVLVRSLGTGCGVHSTCTLPQAVASTALLQAARGTGLGTIRVTLEVEPVSSPTPLDFVLRG
ncbi:MAG TPA: hypothetical protein VLW49_08375 [Gaiellaceae bacterium]|nr:hypothetical protein [Gaiellaceae bacterium]